MKIEALDTPDAELYLPEEYRLINKTVNIRERIVDEMIKDGLPYKTNEIRVINELLNAIDGNVLGRVDRRLKYSENEGEKDMRDMVKALILEGDKIKREMKPVELNQTLPEEYVLDNPTPGEDKIDYEEITLEDIRGE